MGVPPQRCERSGNYFVLNIQIWLEYMTINLEMHDL